MGVQSSGVDLPYGVAELAPLAAGAVGSDVPVPDAEAGAAAERERQLWAQHLEQHLPEAREALIMLHLPYARGVAAKLYRQHIHHETEYEEYVQWGTLGLIEALDRYDPNRGAQFRTYAYVRILGAIRNGLEHISERQEQLSLQRRLLAERVEAAKGERDPNRAGQSDMEVLRSMAEISASLMVSFMLDDTGMLQGPLDSLPDGCYESLAFKQEQQRLRSLINELTEREQSVVKLHYLQGLTYENIARTLGITKGRVSQLHEQALNRLRRLFTGAL